MGTLWNPIKPPGASLSPHSEQTPKQVTQTSVFIVSQSTNELLTSIWSQGVHMI